MSTQARIIKDNNRVNEKYFPGMLLYPIDMAAFLNLEQISLDANGIPHDANSSEFHPTIIAQYALVHWNRYLTTNDEQHRQSFLNQAHWLLDHQQNTGNHVGGWAVPRRVPDIPTNSSLFSATVQGNCLSVLIRAYQLTAQEAFLESASLAIRPFERDILDGGIMAPVGSEGIFFQDDSVYPAAHSLIGCLFALLGLYEYVALVDDMHIKQIINRCMNTLHRLFDEFDMGFWSYTDLLHRQLTTPRLLLLQVRLLATLAECSDCEHCAALASRWEGYQHHFASRLRFFMTRRVAMIKQAFWGYWQVKLFPKGENSDVVRICIPVTGFPVTGGIRTVLIGVARVMNDLWQIEYLTQNVQPHVEAFVIHKFGTRPMAPWQFPSVWLYVLSGFRKLVSLLHNGSSYSVIMPQDGVYSAAFAGIAARLAGIRVVCIDHGNLTLLDSRAYRDESLEVVATKNWSLPRRLFARLRLVAYWPTLRFLARIAARYVDHYLVPGIEGDGIEEDCERLGIRQSRITRFASMIDIDRHVIPDAVSRASTREAKGIAADAIVIAVISRLSPEKGIEVALKGFSLALSKLPPELRHRTRVIVAGDGPLRKSIEDDIVRLALHQNCVLWGEISPTDVITLLGISDIFLYASTRGACFSMAVLEAMASACAVIATTKPLSNKHLLAEGRGIAVPSNDVEQIGEAIAHLVNNLELSHLMGQRARDYIAVQHSSTMFRRTLLRATQWFPMDELLESEKKGMDVVVEGGS